MERQKNKALRVGVLVFSALVILVLTIYFIGSKNNLFKSKTNVICTFKDIRGVVVGNNVRFSGINVGSVKSIEITSDSTVELTLAIAKEYARFIYRNSIVEISQDGLVGNKLLLISSGTVNSGAIQDGDNLRAKYGIDIENMLGEAREMLTQAKEAVVSLKSITKKIDSGDGDIAKLLNENTLTTQLNTTTQRLNSALANVDHITKKIDNGHGDLGKLVNNNDITNQAYAILGNLKQTGQKADNVVSELQTTTKNINNGDGTLSLLLNNKQMAHKVDTTIVNVNNSLAQFNKTAKAIEESWIVKLFSKKKKKDTAANDSITNKK